MSPRNAMPTLGPWTATMLPLPRGFIRSKALGFCAGAPVGMAERANGKGTACWWPAGATELLALTGQKELRALSARGDLIAGSWNKSTSGKSGAAAWRAAGPALDGRDLHVSRFELTWAEGAGGGLIVGVGTHKGKLGARRPDSGLVWDPAAGVVEVAAAEDVCLRATDGTRLGGSIGGRAALWPAVDAPAVDLAPPAMPASELYALDGELQVGYAFADDGARALLWRGTADSVRDLTPTGFTEARAFDGADGFQAGFIRPRASTPSGVAALDDRAVLWHGAADRWWDLNAVLPTGFNASVAWAVHVTDDSVSVCGEARQIVVQNEGTDQESHGLEHSQAVLWTARRTLGS